MRRRELAASRILFGYRRPRVMLRREGWKVNTKRIYRLYREDGLAARTKVPKTLARRAHAVWLKYADERQLEATADTVHLELGVAKRAYKLAHADGLVSRVPDFPRIGNLRVARASSIRRSGRSCARSCGPTFAMRETSRFAAGRAKWKP